MYNTDDMRRVYGITEEEGRLAHEAEEFKNEIRGEKAYIALMKSVLGRNGSKDILYDVMMDWDPGYRIALKDEMDEVWNRYER